MWPWALLHSSSSSPPSITYPHMQTSRSAMPTSASPAAIIARGRAGGNRLGGRPAGLGAERRELQLRGGVVQGRERLVGVDTDPEGLEAADLGRVGEAVDVGDGPGGHQGLGERPPPAAALAAVGGQAE